MKDVTEIKVRGYHLDLYGHINNARYLEFLEEGRWSFIEEHIDIDEWRKRGWLFIAVNININYRKLAFLGEILEICTESPQLGKNSAIMHQKIVLKGTDKIIADADVTFVIIDPHTGKTLPLRGELREAFKKMSGKGI